MWLYLVCWAFFFSSRRRHTILVGDWSSDVCSSDLRCRERSDKAGSSDLHHFLLLRRDDLLDLLDPVVGLLLHLLEGLLGVVLGDLTVLLRRLDQLLGVAPLVPDGDLELLALPLHLLHDLPAALLGERRDRDADEILVALGVVAEVGVADRLVDDRDEVLLPGLHQDEPRLWDRERRDLVQRRGGAVVVDADAVEHVEAGAAGADRRQVVPERLQRLGDAAVQVGQDLFGGAHRSLPLSVSRRASAPRCCGRRPSRSPRP